MVEIRPATKEDIDELYGHRHKYSMRAITAVIDGLPVGIAGVYYDGVSVVAFSVIKPELRVYPFAIYKAARMVKNMIKKNKVPAYAVADPKIEGSSELLIHLGFEHVGPSTQGEVYKWNPDTLLPQ